MCILLQLNALQSLSKNWFLWKSVTRVATFRRLLLCVSCCVLSCHLLLLLVVPIPEAECVTPTLLSVLLDHLNSTSTWHASFSSCLQAAVFLCPCYFCLNSLKKNKLKKSSSTGWGSLSSIHKSLLLNFTLFCGSCIVKLLC